MYKKLLLITLTISSVVQAEYICNGDDCYIPNEPEQVVPWPDTNYEPGCPAFGCLNCRKGTPDMFNDNLPTLDNPNL